MNRHSTTPFTFSLRTLIIFYKQISITHKKIIKLIKFRKQFSPTDGWIAMSHGTFFEGVGWEKD